MQRPVMNPDLFDVDAPQVQSQRKKLLRILTLAIWRAIRAGSRLLTYRPFARPKLRVEDGTRMQRFIRGLLYRLAFVPLFVAAAACAVVWSATHPHPVSAEIDPTSENLFYNPVTFLSQDKVPLEGWLVPVIEAKTIITEKDRALRKKYPAVVLVHDLGQRRQQMMPFVQPLHDAGYVVLAINLRGGGNYASVGQTFGLHESNDVKAAAQMLARRSYVDPNRIAVIGYGTGATAALLAADSDATIAAVVAENPVSDSEELVDKLLMPRQAGIGWLTPLCKWTFELAYEVNADDVKLHNFKKLFNSRRVLMFSNVDPFSERTIAQSKSFLDSAMKANPHY
jgi:pimeloyl-ACP methyl ester carboxylesterase